MRKAALTRGERPKERLRVRFHAVGAGRSIAGAYHLRSNGATSAIPDDAGFAALLVGRASESAGAGDERFLAARFRVERGPNALLAGVARSRGTPNVSSNRPTGDAGVGAFLAAEAGITFAAPLRVEYPVRSAWVRATGGGPSVALPQRPSPHSTMVAKRAGIKPSGWRIPRQP